MIFSGSPNPETGYCDRIGEDTEIGKSAFNTNYLGQTYVGYSYSSITGYNTGIDDATYGTSVEYEKGHYILKNTNSELDNNHHYRCDNSECSIVRFYFLNNNSYRYITLSNGDTVESFLNNTFSGNIPSTIQKVINDWWDDLDSTYGSYLEDTNWCIDRSSTNSNLGGYSPTGNLSNLLLFDVSKRVYNGNENDPPRLTCSRIEDNLSVQNGQLTYPLALLTYDELAFAGAKWATENSSFYLYTNSSYWLISPRKLIYGVDSTVGYVMASGGLDGRYVYKTDDGVRPVLSIKAEIEITGGTGTPETPFLIGPQS